MKTSFVFVLVISLLFVPAILSPTSCWAAGEEVAIRLLEQGTNALLTLSGGEGFLVSYILSKSLTFAFDGVKYFIYCAADLEQQRPLISFGNKITDSAEIQRIRDIIEEYGSREMTNLEIMIFAENWEFNCFIADALINLGIRYISQPCTLGDLYYLLAEFTPDLLIVGVDPGNASTLVDLVQVIRQYEDEVALKPVPIISIGAERILKDMQYQEIREELLEAFPWTNESEKITYWLLSALRRFLELD